MYRSAYRNLIQLSATWALFALFALPLLGATWTVCPTGCDAVTVQQAIALSSSGDVVELLTTVPHTEVDVVINKSVEIRGLVDVGGGIQAAATQGTAPGRVFTILAGNFVTIRDLEIRHGNATEGGGIFNQGQLLLDRVTLRRNTGGDGGGLYNHSQGSVVFRDCFLDENDADEGGAIYSEGYVSLDRSYVQRNDAFFFGAGISMQGGGGDIRNTYFRDNQALPNHGGAIYATAGRLQISDSLFKENKGDTGGAIFTSGDAVVTVVATSFEANEGEQGGAIAHHSQSRLTLRAVTMAFNVAARTGGGLYVRGERTAHLSSSTITHNRSDQGTAGGGGGGIRIGDECSSPPICFPAQVSIANTLIAENTDDFDDEAEDCAGILSSGGYNLVGRGSTGSVGRCRVEGDLTGLLLNLDPEVDLFGVHGGPETWPGIIVPTRPLEATSPARNAGNPAGCADGFGNTRSWDQRYAAHVGTCDIGAFEYDGVPMPPVLLFHDGFESGGTVFWSESSP